MTGRERFGNQMHSRPVDRCPPNVKEDDYLYCPGIKEKLSGMDGS